MGLFKKLKKMHKKSLGHKILKKAVSMDPLAKKSKLLKGVGLVDGKKRSKGLGGETPSATSKARSDLAPEGSRVRALQDRGAKIGYAGPAKPAMQTGGGAQKTPVTTKPMQTGGPNKPATTAGVTQRRGPSNAGVNLNRIAKGYKAR